MSKSIRLNKLKLKNFKGIKDFALDADGIDINIYGDNATGKTTIFDAFTWLLFDKDSKDRKDFEIKTLNTNGEPMHGLEHEVEAELGVGGKTLTLRKVYYEKWTRKRGSATDEFTGHTTDYFIDGVPVQKKEYENKIAEIAEENIFKLLTSPTYFNEQLRWQDRRTILLDICGNITDKDVIAAEPSLVKLPEILNGRSLDDHRKVIVAKRAEINRELEKIPVRIDEVNLSLPDISGIMAGKLDDDIAKLKDKIQVKEKELVRIEAGGEIAEKKKQLAEIEAEILCLQNNFWAESKNEIERKRQDINHYRQLISDTKYEISCIQRRCDDYANQIEMLEAKNIKLREEWIRINSRQFICDENCPTCGQPLPVEQIEEARAKFNCQKAEELELISAEGKQNNNQITKLKNEIAEIKGEITQRQNEVQKYERQIIDLQNEINILEEQNNISKTPEYIQKLKEKEQIEKEINELRNNVSAATLSVKTEIETLKHGLQSLEEAKAKIKQREQGLKRIEELKAEEKRLAKEYEELESQLYLTEEFIRTKVRLLEEKINSRFKYARFKLFEQQINGGISETCITLYKGVPYPDLNGAAKIQIGLDIINTLSEHYNFTAPIFIDERESITRLIPVNSQIISLIVSPKDKNLRVQFNTQNENMEIESIYQN